MGDSLKDVKDLGSSFARKVASRQLPAVREYAEALQGYVDGKMDEIELGKSLFNLGVRESARNAEDFVKFGFELWSKALSLSGVKLGEAASDLGASAANVAKPDLP